MKITLTEREVSTIAKMVETLPSKVRSLKEEWFYDISPTPEKGLEIEIQEGFVLTLLEFSKDVLEVYFKYTSVLVETIIPKYGDKFRKLSEDAKERLH